MIMHTAINPHPYLSCPFLLASPFPPSSLNCPPSLHPPSLHPPLPPPSTHPVPPTFTQAPTNSTATENTRHTLTCAATGDPTPMITWSRDGTTRSTQGTLVFPLIFRSDTGQYTCTASNSAGRISGTIFLDVLCKRLVELDNFFQSI